MLNLRKTNITESNLLIAQCILELFFEIKTSSVQDLKKYQPEIEPLSFNLFLKSHTEEALFESILLNLAPSFNIAFGYAVKVIGRPQEVSLDFEIVPAFIAAIFKKQDDLMNIDQIVWNRTMIDVFKKLGSLDKLVDEGTLDEKFDIRTGFISLILLEEVFNHELSKSKKKRLPVCPVVEIRNEIGSYEMRDFLTFAADIILLSLNKLSFPQTPSFNMDSLKNIVQHFVEVDLINVYQNKTDALELTLSSLKNQLAGYNLN